MASGKEALSAEGAQPSEAGGSLDGGGKDDAAPTTAELGMYREGVLHRLEPSVDAKLSTLMFNFLALPESAALVSSLVRDFKAGKPLEAPPIPTYVDAPLLTVGVLEGAAAVSERDEDVAVAAGKSSAATLLATSAGSKDRRGELATTASGGAEGSADLAVLTSGKGMLGNAQSPPLSPRQRKKQQKTGECSSKSMHALHPAHCPMNPSTRLRR